MVAMGSNKRGRNESQSEHEEKHHKYDLRSNHSDASDHEEEEVKIHKKKETKNGFDKHHSNTAEEEKRYNALTELATDVKSKEAQESGDFNKFNLPSQLIKKLKTKNIQYLYPIQIATLNHIRAGHDVIAQARTGTGKTMAFGIPIVEKLEAVKKDNEISKTPKCLVLEPTRELAKQVGDDFTSISTKLSTCCVYGGVSYEKVRKLN
jgi:ATP-dependent RNA helicase DDX21